MTFLKTFLVLLFSLVLVSSQNVFATTAAVSGEIAKGQDCRCCACGGSDCCMQQSSSTPSVPLTATAPNLNLQAQQFVAALCTLLLHPPQLDGAADRISSLTTSTSSVPAVPLFKRNCAFLI